MLGLPMVRRYRCLGGGEGERAPVAEDVRHRHDPVGNLESTRGCYSCVCLKCEQGGALYTHLLLLLHGRQKLDYSVVYADH